MWSRPPKLRHYKEPICWIWQNIQKTKTRHATFWTNQNLSNPTEHVTSSVLLSWYYATTTNKNDPASAAVGWGEVDTGAEPACWPNANPVSEGLPSSLTHLLTYSCLSPHQLGWLNCRTGNSKSNLASNLEWFLPVHNAQQSSTTKDIYSYMILSTNCSQHITPPQTLSITHLMC